MLDHWLITVGCDAPDYTTTTLATELHPAEWFAKHGTAFDSVVFAMPITAQQAKAVTDAGHKGRW